jgi:hypothetical protein
MAVATACQEVLDQGFEQRDSEHIAQSVCNDCDVFLTGQFRGFRGKEMLTGGVDG